MHLNYILINKKTQEKSSKVTSITSSNSWTMINNACCETNKNSFQKMFTGKFVPFPFNIWQSRYIYDETSICIYHFESDIISRKYCAGQPFLSHLIMLQQICKIKSEWAVKYFEYFMCVSRSCFSNSFFFSLYYCYDYCTRRRSFMWNSECIYSCKLYRRIKWIKERKSEYNVVELNKINACMHSIPLSVCSSSPYKSKLLVFSI